jgi:hypothetical protein
MFEKNLRFEQRTLRYSISPSGSGWEVREVREDGNREVVKTIHVSDWHRVERARRSIAVKVDDLRRKGWRDVTS